MSGFEFSHRTGHATPTVQPFVVKSGVTDLSGGVLVNIESGEVDLAATADTKLAGLVLAPVDPQVSLSALPAGAQVEVITDADAVYRCADANARLQGATLDIAAGAKGVAASSNADLIVTAKSTNAMPTHVRIASSQHWTNA